MCCRTQVTTFSELPIQTWSSVTFVESREPMVYSCLLLAEGLEGIGPVSRSPEECAQ
jgi:hypothetical protein